MLLAATAPLLAEAVLMCLQFGRAGRAWLNYGPYSDAMRTLAATSAHTTLHLGSKLMPYWAETGRIDVECAPRAEWTQAANRLHAPLGKVLAAVMADGIALSR